MKVLTERLGRRISRKYGRPGAIGLLLLVLLLVAAACGEEAVNVYVVDNNNSRVQKFDSAGAFVANWGSEGSGDDQFGNPLGIAVVGSGDVYVVDYDRIQKFSASGQFLAQWALEAQVMASSLPLRA